MAAALAASCRAPAPPGALDSRMASCVPADTLVLAAIDLDQVRGSAIYPALPIAPAVVDSFHDASRVAAAFNGQALLMIAGGRFRAAPAGWTLVESGLAVSGAESAVQAALLQHGGRQGKARVLMDADRVAAGKPAWVVALGGVSLPLSGNAENLNRLLEKSEYGSLTLTLAPVVRVEAIFAAQNDAAAAELEKTLRAFIELARMAEKRGSEADSILGAIELKRENTVVRASVGVDPDGFGKLVQSLTR